MMPWSLLGGPSPPGAFLLLPAALHGGALCVCSRAPPRRPQVLSRWRRAIAPLRLAFGGLPRGLHYMRLQFTRLDLRPHGVLLSLPADFYGGALRV